MGRAVRATCDRAGDCSTTADPAQTSVVRYSSSLIPLPPDTYFVSLVTSGLNALRRLITANWAVDGDAPLIALRHRCNISKHGDCLMSRLSSETRGRSATVSGRRKRRASGRHQRRTSGTSNTADRGPPTFASSFRSDGCRSPLKSDTTPAMQHYCNSVRTQRVKSRRVAVDRIFFGVNQATGDQSRSFSYQSAGSLGVKRGTTQRGDLRAKTPTFTTTGALP